MKLSKPQKVFLAIVMMLVVIRFTACTRYVHWEEDVLLNTGETISIDKNVRYTLKGDAGNPFDMAMRPDWEETISFKYGGRSYRYTGEAGLMVLAISPQKLPILLAPVSLGDWFYHNNYACVSPYYVQLVPDNSGKQWTWPVRIESWTYNLPANLLRQRDHPSAMQSRYTMAEKAEQRYMHDQQLLDTQKINPLRKSPNGCFKYTE